MIKASARKRAKTTRERAEPLIKPPFGDHAAIKAKWSLDDLRSRPIALDHRADLPLGDLEDPGTTASQHPGEALTPHESTRVGYEQARLRPRRAGSDVIRERRLSRSLRTSSRTRPRPTYGGSLLARIRRRPSSERGQPLRWLRRFPTTDGGDGRSRPSRRHRGDSPW
jgi:hypothetical protein